MKFTLQWLIAIKQSLIRADAISARNGFGYRLIVIMIMVSVITIASSITTLLDWDTFWVVNSILAIIMVLAFIVLMSFIFADLFTKIQDPAMFGEWVYKQKLDYESAYALYKDSVMHKDYLNIEVSVDMFMQNTIAVARDDLPKIVSAYQELLNRIFKHDKIGRLFFEWFTNHHAISIIKAKQSKYLATYAFEIRIPSEGLLMIAITFIDDVPVIRHIEDITNDPGKYSEAHQTPNENPEPIS